MKYRILVMALLVVGGLLYAGWADQGGAKPMYEDGTYRGAFIDRDEIQVNIEFTLEDHRVTQIEYRHLHAQGDEYLHAEDGTLEARLRDEYLKIIGHLEGNDIRTHLTDLYHPENIASDLEADGLTAATMRSSKMISAIRDALMRGVYSYPE